MRAQKNTLRIFSFEKQLYTVYTKVQIKITLHVTCMHDFDDAAPDVVSAPISTCFWGVG